MTQNVTISWAATVRGIDLRTALEAVMPHRDATGNHPILSNILVELRDDPTWANPDDGLRDEHRVLLLTATDRYTIAHAIVPCEWYDHNGAWWGRTLLNPDDADDLHTRARRANGRRGAPVTVTLTGGETHGYPNLYELTAREMFPKINLERVALSDATLFKLTKSAKALREGISLYGAPGGGVVATVGQRFVALAAPLRPGPDSVVNVWRATLEAACRDWSS